MLRATMGTGTNAMKQLSSIEWVGVNSTFSQIIRWKKKPLWLPPAKSKLFKISSRYRPPPEEFIEIRRLHNNYKTYRKSLRAYFMKIVSDNKVQFDEEVVRKTEDEDYKRSMEINDEWNNQLKIIRDQRLAEEKAEMENAVMEQLMKAEIEERKLKEEMEEKVKKAREESMAFITPKNIDQAIEEALANIVNYNAAVDINGNEYKDINNVVEEKVEQSIQQ